MDIYRAQELILNKIIFEIKNNLILKQNIISAALLGSFKTKEAIKNYSDLDVLFILKSDRFGEIDSKAVLNLKLLVEKIKKYGIEISFLSHSIFDFQYYVDVNYLIHYSWGHVFYGNKKQFIQLFNKIIKTKNFSDKNRKKLVRYNISHARFNLIRKYISWTDFSTVGLKKLMKLYIDGIVEICDWSLIYKNLFLRSKHEILERFLIEYKDWNDDELVNNIILMREKIMEEKYNRKKIDMLIKKFIQLINYCNRKVYE